MTTLVRRAAAAASLVLALVGGIQAVAMPTASAVPCGTQCAAVHLSVVDVSTFPNDTLFELGAFASCRNPGGTCSITKGESKTTTIQTALSASADWVGGQIGFSVGYTSSTSVTCNSPKLKAGQVYRAYVVGVTKIYKIKRTVGADVTISNPLFAHQPYKAQISCRVEAA